MISIRFLQKGVVLTTRMAFLRCLWLPPAASSPTVVLALREPVGGAKACHHHRSWVQVPSSCRCLSWLLLKLAGLGVVPTQWVDDTYGAKAIVTKLLFWDCSINLAAFN